MNVDHGRNLTFAALAGLALFIGVACSDQDRDADSTAESTSAEETAASDDGTQTIAETSGTAVLSTWYVGNTGGTGVAVRDACQDEARAGGSWQLGAQVILLWPGEDECEGWSHITGANGPSWIRTEFLVTDAPAGGSVSGSTAATTSNVPQTGAPPPAATTTQPRPTAATTPAPVVTLPALQIPQPGGGVITSTSLDGVGILYGGAAGYDYLGLISSSRSGNSICNSGGAYGSPGSPTSVRNPQGQFGRQDAGPVDATFNSEYSPYVSSAENPPKITLNGEIVGYLTTNVDKFGTRAVSPAALFRALGC